jgi:hypothetical protein
MSGQIRSEATVVIGVGVPEDERERWEQIAVALLEERGFTCKALTPADIVEQGKYIEHVWAKALDDVNNH